MLTIIYSSFIQGDFDNSYGGDSMLSGYQFTTKDRDNDVYDPDNCATIFTGKNDQPTMLNLCINEIHTRTMQYLLQTVHVCFGQVNQSSWLIQLETFQLCRHSYAKLRTICCRKNIFRLRYVASKLMGQLLRMPNHQGVKNLGTTPLVTPIIV